MASHRDDKAKMITSNEDTAKTDLLLHPELLSREFILHVLRERKIAVADDEERERLTALYLRHVLPLPQRDLPTSRWGRMMEKRRACQNSTRGHSSSTDGDRKRPLIVFDGSSTNTSVKIKKSDFSPATVSSSRLKPPVTSVSLINPVRKISGSSTTFCASLSSKSISRSPTSSQATSCISTSQSEPCNNSSGHSNSVKRSAPSDQHCLLTAPDLKKKIQHITWP